MKSSFSSRIPENSYTKKYREPFAEFAEEYRKKPIESIPYSVFRLYRDTGSRVEYEALYFDLRRRVDVFAVMVLSGKKEYLPDLEDALCAVLEQYTWALPAHLAKVKSAEEEVTKIDLFAAETAQMLSELLFLLREELSEEIGGRIKYEVRRRILTPYREKRTKWAKSNWSAVCAFGVLSAFYYLADAAETEEVLPDLCESLEVFLSSYCDDGCCSEGPLYWSYGFGTFVSAAAMLREFTDGRINYFKEEKVRKIAEYGFCLYLKDNMTVPFADAPHRMNFNVGLYHFLKKEYPELPLPDANFAENFGDEERFRFFQMIRDLYWFDETLPAARTFPERVDFPESQVFIRHRKELHLACKGGHNAEVHNHNDVGSFVLISGDEYILDDPGWPEYDKGYSQKESRYRDYLCARSDGHSLPIFGGEGQKFGAEYAARLLKNEDDEIVLDLSGAYGLKEGSIERAFLLTDHSFVLRDRFSEELAGNAGEKKIIDRLVTRATPKRGEENTLLIGDCVLSFPAGVTLKIKTETFTPRSVCRIGMKPVETLFLIDVEVPGNEMIWSVQKRGK